MVGLGFSTYPRPYLKVSPFKPWRGNPSHHFRAPTALWTLRVSIHQLKGKCEYWVPLNSYIQWLLIQCESSALCKTQLNTQIILSCMPFRFKKFPASYNTQMQRHSPHNKTLTTTQGLQVLHQTVFLAPTNNYHQYPFDRQLSISRSLCSFLAISLAIYSSISLLISPSP